MHFEILAPLINPAIPTGMTEFHFIALGGNRARWTLTEEEIEKLLGEMEPLGISLEPLRVHAIRTLSRWANADTRNLSQYEEMKEMAVWLAARSYLGRPLLYARLAQCGFLAMPRQQPGETHRLHVFGIPRLAH